MPEGALLLAFVTAQRLAELVWARRNTRALIARGAVEVGAAHYPLIVLLHAAWLATLWALAFDQPVDRLWLTVFVVLQAARVWILAILGPRWTTRIIVLPGEALVARGPYRLLRHPNYALVMLEIVVVPLALGLPLAALAFGLANIAVLAVRIRREDTALAEAIAAKIK